MNKIKRLAVAALAGTILAGCGGGSGTPAPTDALAGGRAALNKLAGSQTAADSPTLQSILALFEKAVQQNPGSSEAHFGVALCMAGIAGNSLDGGPSSAELSTSTVTGPGPTGGGIFPGPIAAPGGNPGLPTPPMMGEVPPTPNTHSQAPQPLPPAHKLALIWNIDSGLANPYALLNMLSPLGNLQYGLIPFYGYSSDNADIARRQKLLDALTTVDQNLQTVESDPTFATTLPDPNRSGQPVAVGLPEVYLFDAYVNSLRVEVALSLAYVRDPGGNHVVDPPVPVVGTAGAPAIFASGGGASGSGTGAGGTITPTVPPNPFLILDTNHDGKLTPDEYLPPSPFLTLRDASYLTAAQQALIATADQETKGIAGVLARPADAIFLVSNTDSVRGALTEVRDHVVPLIQQAATGPVTIVVPHYAEPLLPIANGGSAGPASGSDRAGVFSVAPQTAPGTIVAPAPILFTTESLTIDIAAWFAKPPADLKAFAPTYTLDSQEFPDSNLTKYPDPTFGGLYPNGLPTDLTL